MYRSTEQRIADLDDAITEAQRFIKRARLGKKELKDDKGWGRTHLAAAKRASMDLSRALTNVR